VRLLHGRFGAPRGVRPRKPGTRLVWLSERQGGSSGGVRGLGELQFSFHRLLLWVTKLLTFLPMAEAQGPLCGRGMLLYMLAARALITIAASSSNMAAAVRLWHT